VFEGEWAVGREWPPMGGGNEVDGMARREPEPRQERRRAGYHAGRSRSRRVSDADPKFSRTTRMWSRKSSFRIRMEGIHSDRRAADVTLRDTIQELEAKLQELVSYGKENDNQRQRCIVTTLQYLALPNSRHAAVLYHSLKEDFAAAAGRGAAVGGRCRSNRICRACGDVVGKPANTPISWEALFRPGRGVRVARMSRAGRRVAEFAFLRCAPRTRSECSRSQSDPQRFHSRMGTAVSKRLAKLASVATARLPAAS